MAATALVKDVLWRASVLLLDTNPQYLRVPERDMVDYLNDAQSAIAKYLPMASSRVDAIKLKAGTRQSIAAIAAADCKPGDGSTPTGTIYGTKLLDVPRNMGTAGTTAGKSIRIVPRKDLDLSDPDWHTRANAAGVIRTFSYDPLTPGYFYVSPPVPASPVVWVEAAYTAKPTMVLNTGAPGSELYLKDGASTATIGVDDQYLDDLVNYVVARANMGDAEWADGNKASYFANLFNGSLNAQAEAALGVNPNLKRLPFAPTPMGAAS